MHYKKVKLHVLFKSEVSPETIPVEEFLPQRTFLNKTFINLFYQMTHIQLIKL